MVQTPRRHWGHATVWGSLWVDTGSEDLGAATQNTAKSPKFIPIIQVTPGTGANPVTKSGLRLFRFANRQRKESAKDLRRTRRAHPAALLLHVGKPFYQGGAAARPIPDQIQQQPLPPRPATLHHLVCPPRRCRQRCRFPGCFGMVAPGCFGCRRRRRLSGLGCFRAPASGLPRHRAAGRRVPGPPVCKHARDAAGMFADSPSRHGAEPKCGSGVANHRRAACCHDHRP